MTRGGAICDTVDCLFCTEEEGFEVVLPAFNVVWSNLSLRRQRMNGLLE